MTPGGRGHASRGGSRLAASGEPGLRRLLTRQVGRWLTVPGPQDDPLFRNAYALMINTGATGLLGVGYWLLAAHLYTAADVGRASAAYVAMNLLAGLTAVTFTGALTRFIPQSGQRTRALIVMAYLTSSVASLAVAIAFLVTLGRGGGSYTEFGGLPARFAFTGCVVAWGVFTLQDGVLTGLRSAIWVAVKNGAFGVAKLFLLVALAAALPRLGIYISWMAPVLLAVPLINVLIFGRLAPGHMELTSDRPPPTAGQIGRFLAGDYTGALCLLATTTLVPVLVAADTDPGRNAIFYVAWTIGAVLDLLAVNMAASLTVEGAADTASLPVNSRAALRRTVLILTPVAAGLALLAPWALGLFGPGYRGGAPILELLVIASLPKALTELHLGALRAQSRTGRVALIQGARAALLLGLTAGLISLIGIVGAGVAALATQSAIALLVSPALRRILVNARRPFAPAREGSRYSLSTVLRLAAFTLATIGLVLAAGAAFVISYPATLQIALKAGAAGDLARVYPMVLDAMMVTACATALALRRAGRQSRRRAWLSLFLLFGAVAAGDAGYAVAAVAPPQPYRVAAAVTPWALPLLAFALWLSAVRHAHATRVTAMNPVKTQARPLVRADRPSGADSHTRTRSHAEPAAPGQSRRWPVMAVGVLAAVGFTLFVVPLPAVDLSQMTGAGLISVLPTASLTGVALLALAFILGLGLRRPYPLVLGSVLVAVVVCLDGAPAMIESEPRFPTAYQIAGFVNYVLRTGHSAPGLEAYFSWPGFFALVAFLAGASGQHGLLTVLRVWPLVIDVLCLPPYFLLTRNLRAGWRARWFAALLFTLGNWVGQDYFSPQSFNYLLYLVFVAICVNWFMVRSPGRDWAGGRLRLAVRAHRRVFGTLSPGEHAARPATMPQRAILLLFLIAIFTVSVTSHPLTPFYLLGAIAGLVLARRCTLTGLPVLLGTVLTGWVSFAAVDYWSGHMSTVFGSVGTVLSNLSLSVGGRMIGSTPAHVEALYARIAVAGTIVALTCLGFLRRRMRGIDDRVAIVLCCAPFVMILTQNYGGEVVLRSYLFMLPGGCLLGAYFVFPSDRCGRPSWPVLLAAAAGAMTLSVAFFLAAYGNETFERVPRGELAAANYVYAHDSRGVRLAWLTESPSIDVTPQMPWAYRDITKVEYVPVRAPENPDSTAGLVALLHRLGPTGYLITTATQNDFLEQAAGYAADWGSRFRASMAAAPGVRVVFANPSAVVYALRWPPGALPRPLRNPSAGSGHRPVLATIGLVILVLVLLTLAARELVRVCVPRASRIVRPLALASAPLVVLLVGIVVARFVQIG